MKQCILVVDDEPQIRKQLRYALGGYGYDVITATTGDEALAAAAQHNPDTIILDVSLGAEPDGIDLCRRIREWSSVPIIMLSVHGEDKMIVTALHAGADDYLTKPFSMEELQARITAIRRRASLTSDISTGAKSEITVGDLRIDLASRLVFVAGEAVHLTPTEYELLHLLATHAGKVLTHKWILSQVWGPEYSEMDHYVRVFVNQLRKKLRENPQRNVRYILNEPGVGYRFISPKS